MNFNAPDFEKLEALSGGTPNQEQWEQALVWDGEVMIRGEVDDVLAAVSAGDPLESFITVLKLKNGRDPYLCIEWYRGGELRRYTYGRSMCDLWQRASEVALSHLGVTWTDMKAAQHLVAAAA